MQIITNPRTIHVSRDTIHMENKTFNVRTESAELTSNLETNKRETKTPLLLEIIWS